MIRNELEEKEKEGRQRKGVGYVGGGEKNQEKKKKKKKKEETTFHKFCCEISA